MSLARRCEIGTYSFLVFAMAWTCSICFQVTRVETESANSQPGLPTTIPDHRPFADPIITMRSQVWNSSQGDSFSFTIVRQYGTDGDNLRVFDSKANLISAGSSGTISNYLDTVLPDF